MSTSKQIITTNPHITLFYNEKNKLCLRIKSFELFDRVDDLLTEQLNIKDYYHSIEKTEKNYIYTIFFEQKMEEKELMKIIKNLSTL